MPPYSREFLLLTGMKVLSTPTYRRVSLDTYTCLQKLGISSVKPTQRGKRNGTHFRPKPLADPKQHEPYIGNELTLGLCNARSILNKWDDIIDHIVDNSLDLLMVTETWISPGNENNPHLSFLPAGYKILHVPRPSRRGGGVAIIYRECLNIQSHHSTTAKSFEGLEVVMTIASNCLRLVTLYRPPPSPQNGFSNNQFFTEFTDFVDSKITSSGKLIIAGDFNFHWDNPVNSATIRMKDVLYSANLIQHVTGPTHTSGHTLDWILSLESEDIVSQTVNSSFISDHCFIHCTLKLTKPPLPQEVRAYRSYKSVEPADLLGEVEASSLLQNPSDDLDVLIDQYNRTLSELIDKYAPLKNGIVTIQPVSLRYNK
jgi:hypothetical protein